MRYYSPVRSAPALYTCILSSDYFELGFGFFFATWPGRRVSARDCQKLMRRYDIALYVVVGKEHGVLVTSVKRWRSPW